ncbi:MAG: hypothetical protein ACLFS3_01875 [Candidatus Aenigmatarchaeota archaeon]
MERFVGYIVLGVSIAISAADLSLLLRAVAVEFLVVSIGSVIALYGEYMLMEEIIGGQ